MAKQPKTLDDLFHDTLKDIYYAEKKILTALPKMAKAAQSADLKAAFEKHHGETEEQVARLEDVFKTIDAKPQGKKCDAIEGIIEEGKEIMEEYKDSPALDAGLLAAALLQIFPPVGSSTAFRPEGCSQVPMRSPSASHRRNGSCELKPQNGTQRGRVTRLWG